MYIHDVLDIQILSKSETLKKQEFALKAIGKDEECSSTESEDRSPQLPPTAYEVEEAN